MPCFEGVHGAWPLSRDQGGFGSSDLHFHAHGGLESSSGLLVDMEAELVVSGQSQIPTAGEMEVVDSPEEARVAQVVAAVRVEDAVREEDAALQQEGMLVGRT